MFDALNGVERWGDFNAISRSPTDGTQMALVDQYASADDGPTTSHWQQSVTIVHDG